MGLFVSELDGYLGWGGGGGGSTLLVRAAFLFKFGANATLSVHPIQK